MSAVYQRRGRLWGQAEKAFLIDSILNDFDIPKIYIADFTYVNTPLNASNKPYAIIDGKQRFEAIFDFFDDRLVLEQKFVYFEQPDLDLAGLSLRDLRTRHPKIATKFENFNLTVETVITDDEAKINELFVRLNTSKPLTGSEIRNAMGGKVPELIRNIASHSFFRECVRFQTKRGQDLNAAAKLLLIEFRGEFVDTKKTHLNRFVEEGLKSWTDDVDSAALRVVRVLDTMTTIFIPRDPLLGSQGPLTVLYWLVRTFGKTYEGVIREFLVEFERRRVENRGLAKVASDLVEPEFVLYENLNRSINDEASLIGRFRILSEHLEEFSKLAAPA
ncbi:MAG: DUF262 domain-containing protein [Chloroflexi bacterium]|nr:DUF262 domain-containing protein [Chloroflexota bacterium]